MSYTVFYMNPDATPGVIEIVRRHLPDGWGLTTPTTPFDFSQELAEADFVIVATEPITYDHLSIAGHLKMIQHQGVGYEKIDLDACRHFGILVGITPEGTSVGVAEHTLLLILAVYKRLVTAMNGIAHGNWMQWSLREDSFELSGKTLGLVGFGRIGRAVAKRVLAFDARVIYFDACTNNDHGLDAARRSSLEALLRESDIVSLHLPETIDTRHLINSVTLAQMKPGAVLINASRGGLVEENALLEALQSGHLGGAGLDVFSVEPVPWDHPLLALPNVIATPHIAAGTSDALNAKMKAVFANLLRFTNCELPQNIVPELSELVNETSPRKKDYATESSRAHI